MRRRAIDVVLNPCGASIPLRNCVIGAVLGLVCVSATWQASFAQPGRVWAMTIAPAISAAFGAVLVTVRRSIRTPGILPIAIASAAVAIYACVPETDQMRPVGWTVAGLVCAEVVLRRPLPTVWHGCAATLVLWSGLYGATGRQSALMGALFACLPIVILGVWIAICPTLDHCHEVWRWFVVGLGCLIAVAMARTGGIHQSPAEALGWTVLWGVVLLAVTGLIVWVATTGWPWFRQQK